VDRGVLRAANEVVGGEALWQISETAWLVLVLDPDGNWMSLAEASAK
jgi:hypothetical protein